MKRLAVVALLCSACGGAEERSAAVAHARGSDPVRLPPHLAQRQAPAPSARCDTGYACFQLSRELAAEEKRTGTPAGSIAALGRACALGYAGGCFSLDIWARAAGSAEARRLCNQHRCVEAADRIWRPRCRGAAGFDNSGSLAPARACLGLAQLHHGVHRDGPTAATFARRACALRSGRGCLYAADLVETGEAPAKAPLEAEKLRRRAEELRWQMEPEELWP